ncbi:STAS domain-containing protein [Streptomyces sp. NPDC000983]|uniref:STAS domain-containing protein n=1 Tax=Streptomyces sp. NPDC000983 TaxID=3154373 RepID=UPI00332033C1
MSDHITLVSVPDAESEAQISVYTAPALRTVLVDLMNQGRYFLVVDLTFVALLDSTGLGVLVGCLKRLRAYDGAIVLVAPTVRMQKLLRVVGFQYLFSQFDTVDAAVEFLGRRVPQAYA